MTFGYGTSINPRWSKQDSKNAKLVRLNKEIKKLQDDVDFINRISLKTKISDAVLAHKEYCEIEIQNLKNKQELI